MADKEILVKDGIVVKAPESSVIRPDDIHVEAEKYQTFVSPVISDLAATILAENLKKH